MRHAPLAAAGLALVALLWTWARSRDRATLAQPESGRRASAPTYHGRLVGVRLRSGRYVAIPASRQVEIGTQDGVGWVAAANRRDFDAGRFLAPYDTPDDAFQRVSWVFYERAPDLPTLDGPTRADLGYSDELWKHEVNHTSVALGGRGSLPVLRAQRGHEPYACPAPPGDFVCEG